MKFEEEFPSLKGKEIDLFVTSLEYPNDGRRIADLKTNNKRFCEDMSEILPTSPTVMLGKTDIQKHCVDKQRVRGFVKTIESHWRSGIPKEKWKSMLKELGLEE